MNYDLLFEKCADHNINLNWLIFGEEGMHIVHHSDENREVDFSNDPLDQRTAKCIQMINTLPWSVSAKRILMENYLSLVHEEVGEQHGSNMHSAERD